MPYIKKIHLHGFKSFANPTDILFERGLNVIVGANGSGKSNITDAICFVLGRQKKKSMRVEKTANFIFHGGKIGKPAQEAKVSMVFDNKDRAFSLPTDEIIISRIVRRNGQSIYKINNENKTRQEVLELLAQAGIDPYGFNIILQNEIEQFAKMHTEDRREIIEDIAGIKIYEDRKEKSLHELEKTEAKLKEIQITLNERKAYLKNLEQERAQALKAESLKNDIRKCKASIIARHIDEKKKIIDNINKNIEEKKGIYEKIKARIESAKREINSLNQKIREIEDKITKQTGIEQEYLRQDVSNLKTELATLNLTKNNIDERLILLMNREKGILDTITSLNQQIEELEEGAKNRVTSSERDRFASMNNEIKKLRDKITELENIREGYHITKMEIAKKETRLSEMQKNYIVLQENIHKTNKEIDNLRENIGKIQKEGVSEDILKQKSENLSFIEEKKNSKEIIEKEIIQLLTKQEIHKNNINEILKLDKCPTCKQVVSKEHKDSLKKEMKALLENIEKEIGSKQKSKEIIEKEVQKIYDALAEIDKKEKELSILKQLTREIDDKKSILDSLNSEEAMLSKEIDNIKKEIEDSKKSIVNIENIERVIAENRAKVDKLKEDIFKFKTNKPSLAQLEKDIEFEISLKKKDIENAEITLKNIGREKLELEAKLKETIKEIEKKGIYLSKKQAKQEEIDKKFKAQLEEKERLINEIHNYEKIVQENQIKQIEIESEINELRIDNAKINAEKSTLDMEFKQYENVEVIKAPADELTSRIARYEEELSKIGLVNMRALEVYDKIKAEYEEIEKKLQKLEEEKFCILKIIGEVDKKKKQAFMETFNKLNDSLNRNFMKLSDMGMAFLEIENKEDPFAGGIDIIIKITKNKEVDVSSLSGGQKVLVAISFLLAIQEFKPYCFYVLDEIDAALDKHNSERISSLLRNYVNKSQYIIISHNDQMISQADTIYGATIHEGVSKIVSWKI